MRRAMKVYRADGRKGRKRLERLAGRGREVLDRKTVKAAGRIVERVREGGDDALLSQVKRLDGHAAGSVAELSASALVTNGDSGELPDGFAEALDRAIERVERYHRGQVHAGFRLDHGGVAIEELRTPLARIGIYVPGGRAVYPSTVVMTAVPARLAGVREIVVATPPRSLWGSSRSSAALRHTLDRLGIDEVWGMGGAHAVAALAYGTETIRRVDKIVGPGNAWVTAAKARVAADVGIDSLAGPSEVVIVAGGVEPGGAPDEAEVDRIAADLLAQAEHDPRAAAVLVTDSEDLAKAVARRVGERLDGLETAETAAASIRAFGGAFVVASMDEAAALVERLAPEHLQLVGPAAEALAGRRPPLPAGAIFVGGDTPEVFGDYVAGPSHVLPTCGTARFASALGVEDFVRRSHLVRVTPEAARELAPVAEALARAEGLPAHAASAALRGEAS